MTLLTFIIGLVLGSVIAQLCLNVHWKWALVNTFIAPIYTVLYFTITGLVISLRYIKKLFPRCVKSPQ